MVDRLSQMMRNGTVCHAGMSRIAMRFSPTKIAQAMSTQYARADLRTRSPKSRAMPQARRAPAPAIAGSAVTCIFPSPWSGGYRILRLTDGLMATYRAETFGYPGRSGPGGMGWDPAAPGGGEAGAGQALAVQVITSFMGGRARASAASARVTTAEVTAEGSNPPATRSKPEGVAGRAWARPVCRVQHREYMASIGTDGSSR